jgi:superfamily II DNA or RNA helicase
MGKHHQAIAKAILERFRTGETLVISNVGILTEGFNLPSIEAVQCARPTKSLSLWLQMVGRGLRPSAGKEYALILDHTENWMKLGMPCAKHIWTLEGVEPEEKKPRFRKTKDNEVVEDGFFEIEEGDAELEEIGEDDVKAIAIQLEIEQFNKLLEIAEHRQYKKAWAVYKFLEIEPSYEALLVCAGIMGYKPQWAAMKYKEYA